MLLLKAHIKGHTRRSKTGGVSFVREHEDSREHHIADGGKKMEDITQTESFKKWFGDSKVVDKKGKPLVVYHGTRRKFDIKDMEGSKPRGAIGNPKGIYFTADKREAEEFAQDVDGAWDDKSRIIEAYLRIRSEADGLIRERADGSKEFVIYSPTNIRESDSELSKSHIKAYQRHSKSGAAVQVREHEDKRTKKVEPQKSEKPEETKRVKGQTKLVEAVTNEDFGAVCRYLKRMGPKGYHWDKDALKPIKGGTELKQYLEGLVKSGPDTLFEKFEEAKGEAEHIRAFLMNYTDPEERKKWANQYIGAYVTWGSVTVYGKRSFTNPKGMKEAVTGMWTSGPSSTLAMAVQSICESEFGIAKNYRWSAKEMSDEAARSEYVLKSQWAQTHLKDAVWSIYKDTQKYYKEKGDKTITLHRGVKNKIVSRSGLESWSDDKGVAQRFDGFTVFSEEVPCERVFMSTEAMGDLWPDAYRDEQEFVVMVKR